MGKMILLISILIFVDMIFLIGFPGTLQSHSILAQLIQNPTDINASTFLPSLLSTIASVIVGAGIASGLSYLAGGGRLSLSAELVFFYGIASGLFFTLIQDYIAIYSLVSLSSKTVASLLMIPFIIIFGFIIIEWLKGKD